eukprot:CAMPEP_0183742990 /NCGR_PEP_ID=MMETSP0737-20130205/64985_1 /TAXON_ID=385413 /ORGANISM="Thalassiosira miniscula, Strain CCMP1093" /LENGTH=1110 /DNA_ID=CAMNT_0025978593 /DNA_START=216 /DNA_END=3548 /DNA_ORIENTATION=-
MMRRVSSRPRLVSDADRAFQNATIDDDDGYSSFEEMLDYDAADDGAVFAGGNNYLQSSPRYLQHDGLAMAHGIMNGSAFASHMAYKDDDDAPAHQNDGSFFVSNATTSLGEPLKSADTATAPIDISDTSSSNEEEDLSEFVSCSDLVALQDSFRDKASFVVFPSSSASATTTASSTKRKRLSQQHYLTPRSSLTSSFVVVPPSSTTATTTASSTKRKRLSQQHYLTPRSSLTSSMGFSAHQEVTLGSFSAHQEVTLASPPSTKNAAATLALHTLPAEETLVLIATYLPLSSVRALSSTCQTLRRSLLVGPAATMDVWTHALERSFPRVFRRVDNRTGPRVVGNPPDEEDVPDSNANNDDGAVFDVDEMTRRMNNLPRNRDRITTVAEYLDVRLGRMAVEAAASSSSSAAARLSLRHGGYVDAEEAANGEEDANPTKTLIDPGRVRFVEEYGLPFVGMGSSSSAEGGGGSGSSSNNGNHHRDDGVNLPLLTGLLPAKYPQSIDPATLRARGGFGRHPFRSFVMGVDVENGTASSSLPGGNEAFRPDTAEAAAAAATTIVPVVQFTGTVGRGDRCIRSDVPFPPHCRTVSCLCESAGEGGSPSSSSVAGSLGGLSTWMKNHAPRAGRRGRKHRGSGGGGVGRNGGNHGSIGSSRAVLSLSTARAPAFRPAGGALFPQESSAERYNHRSVHPSLSATAASMMPGRHSPLYRFVSSLSHPGVNGSIDNSDRGAGAVSLSSSYWNRRSSSDASSASGDATDDSDNDGHNYLAAYGIGTTKTHYNLFQTCKQCLGRLRHHHHYHHIYNNNNKGYDDLCPFVIPTVVSDGRNDGNNGGKLVIDVTPRLVAYFEVTIIQQLSSRGSAPDANARETNPPQNNVHHNNAARGGPPQQQQQQQQQQARRNHNLWRMPHRVFPPMMNLPLPFDAQDPLLPMMMHANANNHNNNNLHNFLHNNNAHLNLNHTQRHECVAIGLSTPSFRPHNRMPGWDAESYGYHGDDGGIFHGHGNMLREYGPAFGPGDTVGCGLDYARGRVFFVKNGVFLGYAFDVSRHMNMQNNGSKGSKKKGEEEVFGLYPTVGVDTECPVFVNFGEYPFRFDVREFARNGAGTEDESDY